MRPKKLVMEAFGPYKNRTEIDFTLLGDRGLFLITGKTGSGKSSIFDGICFALYGEKSSSKKNIIVRNQESSPENETMVEFTFDYKGNEYIVRRSPKYERLKKRGEGVVTQNETAFLIMPDGKTYESKDEVNRQIIEILGVTKEQFSQIVMLAQGEFLNLIEAKTEDKKKIFNKILNTDKYIEFTEIINNERNSLKNDIDDINKDINKYILNIIEDNKNSIYKDIFSCFTCNSLKDDVMDTIEKMIGENEIIKEELENEINSLTDIKTELDKEMGRKKEFDSLSLLLKEKEESLPDLEVKYENTKKENDLAEEEYKNKDTFNKYKIELNNNLPLYKEMEDLNVYIDKLSKKITDSENNINENKNIITDFNNEINLLENSKKIIEISKEDINSLLTELNDIKNKIDKLKKIKSDHSTYMESNKKYLDKLEILNNINDDLNKAECLYNSYRNLYMRNIAGILSENLNDNEPCPVCGSLDHPSPAIKEDKDISEDKLKKYENDYDDLKNDFNLINNEVSILKGTNKTLYDSITKSLLSLNIKIENEDEIKDLIKNNINDLLLLKNEKENIKDQYDTDIKNNERIENEIIRINEEIKKIENTNQSIKNEIIKNEIDLNYKNNDLLKYSEKLTFKNKKEAEDEIENIDKKIKKLEINKKNSNDALKKIENDLIEYKTEIKTIKDQLKKLSNIDFKTIEKESSDTNTIIKNKNNSLSNTKIIIKNNKDNKKHLDMLYTDKEKNEHIFGWLDPLARTANGDLTGKDKIKLETYVQMNFFDLLLQTANVRLLKMTDGQYEMVRKEKASRKIQSGLDINIKDNYNSTERDISTLSGGESFMASLSMALGLSDIIQSTSGGIQIDCMFVDEGFGSLDNDRLKSSLKALYDLTEGNRLVGLISHVDYLQENIDKKIKVNKDTINGSTVKIES